MDSPCPWVSGRGNERSEADNSDHGEHLPLQAETRSMVGSEIVQVELAYAQARRPIPCRHGDFLFSSYWKAYMDTMKPGPDQPTARPWLDTRGQDTCMDGDVNVESSLIARAQACYGAELPL